MIGSGACAGMRFRRAEPEDLPQIKTVFRRIVERMDANGIAIWDDVFPCEFFAEDIAERALWLLTDSGTVVSAAALCETTEGADEVRWSVPAQKPLYLRRFGVNVGYQGHGVGAEMLSLLADTAREAGADCLRLFVAEVNAPARRLYERCGFRPIADVFALAFDDGSELRENGMELPL